VSVLKLGVYTEKFTFHHGVCVLVLCMYTRRHRCSNGESTPERDIAFARLARKQTIVAARLKGLVPHARS
jgi:hypothetical protein